MNMNPRLLVACSSAAVRVVCAPARTDMLPPTSPVTDAARPAKAGSKWIDTTGIPPTAPVSAVWIHSLKRVKIW